MADESGLKSYLAQAIFSELEGVKAEIQARSDRQATVLTTCITAIGAIAGVYFTKVTAEARIFFIIPLISFVLGMSWLDHDATIRQLGVFVRNELKWKIADLADVDLQQIPDYERVAASNVSRFGPRFSLFGLPVIIVFIALPILSLLGPFLLVSSDRYDGSMYFMFLIGSMLTLVTLIYFIISLMGVYKIGVK
jgi:hypothetical protein